VEADPRATWERMLKLFPGLLAAGLALIYVLGAIATGGEFEGGNIDPSEAVPLLSIEQLLAHGIGVVVKPATFATIAGSLIMVGAVWLDAATTPDSADESLRDEPAWGLLAGGACLMVLLALALVPINQLAGTVVMACGFMVALFWSDFFPSKPQVRRLGPLLAIAAIIVGLGINAYTDPIPLPSLNLIMKPTGEKIDGAYITHNDSTWYLFQRSTGEIQAYRDDEVGLAAIAQGSNDSGSKQSLGAHALQYAEEILPR
jgi:hypothetical protein